MNAHAKAHLLAAQILAHRAEEADIHDILAGLEVIKLMRTIEECKEATYLRNDGVRIRALARKHPGYVALVESGRDCDGVQYSGIVRYVKATFDSVNDAIADIRYWSDGPCHISIAKPSEVDGIEYTSRDLGMEAFENGHAHCIHG